MHRVPSCEHETYSSPELAIVVSDRYRPGLTSYQRQALMEIQMYYSAQSFFFMEAELARESYAVRHFEPYSEWPDIDYNKSGYHAQQKKSFYNRTVKTSSPSKLITGLINKVS